MPVDRECSGVLTESGLCKDLRRWISPPGSDSGLSVNAPGLEAHEGTATWCAQSSAFTDWRADGSLLWTHGKRTHLIVLWVLLLLTTSWFPSWLRKERYEVCGSFTSSRLC